MHFTKEICLKIDGIDELTAIAEKAQRQLDELIDTVQELNPVQIRVEASLNDERSPGKVPKETCLKN